MADGLERPMGLASKEDATVNSIQRIKALNISITISPDLLQVVRKYSNAVFRMMDHASFMGDQSALISYFLARMRDFMAVASAEVATRGATYRSACDMEGCARSHWPQ